MLSLCAKRRLADAYRSARSPRSDTCRSASIPSPGWSCRFENARHQSRLGGREQPQSPTNTRHRHRSGFAAIGAGAWLRPIHTAPSPAGGPRTESRRSCLLRHPRPCNECIARMTDLQDARLICGEVTSRICGRLSYSIDQSTTANAPAPSRQSVALLPPDDCRVGQRCGDPQLLASGWGRTDSDERVQRAGCGDRADPGPCVRCRDVSEVGGEGEVGQEWPRPRGPW